MLRKLQKRKSTVTLELPVKQLIYALTPHRKAIKRIKHICSGGGGFEAAVDVYKMSSVVSSLVKAGFVPFASSLIKIHLRRLLYELFRMNGTLHGVGKNVMHPHSTWLHFELCIKLARSVVKKLMHRESNRCSRDIRQ